MSAPHPPLPRRAERAALVVALALVALLLPAAARAQPAPPAPPAPEPGSELTVYLVTMGPGDAIWEKFGHNAIWIRDAAQGTDLAYNWGVFDFDDADFVPRFMQGSMRYALAVYPTFPMVDAYVRTNRAVWAQELALTPAQRLQLRALVEENAREENRHYTYNYFLDNCSTRVRDMLDRVLGGRLRAAWDTVPAGTTFRREMRRLTQASQPLYTGMHLVLGQPGDRAISRWEEFFLPMALRGGVQAIAVPGPDGAARPLVVREEPLFAATRAPEPTAPANLVAAYLAIGAALAGLLAWSAHRAARGGRLAARAFGVGGALWSLIAGAVGVILVLVWTSTDHTFMYRNENVLQLSPLSLALAALLPGVARRRHAGPWARRLAVAVAALAVLGALLQALPAFDQVNGEIVALALPVQLAVAWGVWRLRAGTVAPR